MWKPIQILLTFLAAFLTLVHARPAGYDTKVEGLGVKISNYDATNIIPNKYIVVYNSSFDDDAITAAQASVMAAVKKRNLHARGLGGKLLSTSVRTVSMGSWRCMTLEAEDSMIMDIANSDEVAYVEADTVVKASKMVQQTDAPIGLNRISHNEVGSNTYIFDDTAGEGVTVYVIDTGIRTTHSEFGTRATFGKNFAGDGIDTDTNGHGSHVAGTIGGTRFGVAKKANLVGIKVLGADGSGSNSAVVDGMEFVIQNATGKRAVVNMSLGGSFSRVTNNAIKQMTDAGITVVVASGNENQDTELTSPGSAATAITVGAVDNKDARARFSNFGALVDVHAPGVDVQSVGITSDTATDILSGTSMASPHVAGLAAYLIGKEPNLTTFEAVSARIKELAGTTGAAATNVNADTTTLIAYNGSGR